MFCEMFFGYADRTRNTRAFNPENARSFSRVPCFTSTVLYGIIPPSNPPSGLHYYHSFVWYYTSLPTIPPAYATSTVYMVLHL
jgi:hypothetical protein